MGASPPVIAAPTPGYGPPPGLEHVKLSSGPGSGSGSGSNPPRSPDSSAWTVTSGSSRTTSAAGSSRKSGGESVGRTPTHTEVPDGASVRDPFDDFEEDMAGLRVAPDAWEATTDGWGEGQFDYNQEAYGAPDDSEPVENLWADYTPEKEKPPAPETMCPEHGKLCKKGICGVYKKQMRALERQREADAREEAIAAKKANKKGKKKQEGEGSKWFLIVHTLNAHFRHGTTGIGIDFSIDMEVRENRIQ